MKHESEQVDVNVLSVGNARHLKPYYSKEKIPHYLVRLQTEGYAHTWIDDSYVTVRSGDLLLFQPGDDYELKIGYHNPYTNETLPRFNSMDYYLILTGTWIDRWWKDANRPKKISLGLDDRLLTVWRQIAQEKRRVHDQIEEISKYLTMTFFLMLDRMMDEYGASPRKSRYAALCDQMKYFVEQRATDQFTLEQVARHVGLSPSRAGHLFKETFGQSIMDYAIEVRLSIACERIEYSSYTLEHIAEACGFRSYSYFHRTFRSKLGVSPSRYRELNRRK